MIWKESHLGSGTLISSL